MAHIIVTGATGQAGSAVLAHCLASPAINRISVISRRPVKLADGSPKAEVILQSDFSKYSDETLQKLKGATACIWAQGISSRGMQEDAYRTITLTYPITAATAFAKLGPKFNFVHVSGEGADPTGKSRMMFGRVKGQAEQALLDLQSKEPSLSVYNARPSLINPEGKYLADRPPSFQDKASTAFGRILQVVWKSSEISTDKLAAALVKVALGDGQPIAPGVGVEEDGRLLRNTALQRLGTS